MRGWFDAFRNDGGPTLYSASNRTPVTGDMPVITLCLIFFTIFIAFLLILPGVRKERFTTFTSVTLSLYIGTVILVCTYGSDWHVGEIHISSYYRAFSKEKIMADLGVYIGLDHVNVTLKGEPVHNRTEDIDFNERLFWEGATQIQEEFRAALVKGLPFPILTIAEYLSLDDEGFCWGRSYRSAGYYATNLLWTTFATWFLMNLLLIVVPRYGAYMMMVNGGLLLTTNIIYYALLPKTPFSVRFEEVILTFKFGWCYWLILVTGCLCVFVGLTIAVVDLVFPHKFSTILEVDYDTPYDRHIILEESHTTQKRKNKPPRLDEPPATGFGTKLLRTLSKREGGFGDSGLDNAGFEMDPPKSPWRYPHLMMYAKPSPKSVSFRKQSRIESTNEGRRAEASRAFQLSLPLPSHLQHHLERTDSQSSSISSDSGMEVVVSSPTPTDAKPLNFQDQFKSIKRQDSQESNSSVSSFGLSFLTGINSRRGSSEANNKQSSLKFKEEKLRVSREPSLISQQEHRIPSHHLHLTNNNLSLISTSNGIDHRPLMRSASARDPAGVSIETPNGTILIRRNSGEFSRELPVW